MVFGDIPPSFCWLFSLCCFSVPCTIPSPTGPRISTPTEVSCIARRMRLTSLLLLQHRKRQTQESNLLHYHQSFMTQISLLCSCGTSSRLPSTHHSYSESSFAESAFVPTDNRDLLQVFDVVGTDQSALNIRSASKTRGHMDIDGTMPSLLPYLCIHVPSQPHRTVCMYTLRHD